jgi:hypothetical protein
MKKLAFVPHLAASRCRNWHLVNARFGALHWLSGFIGPFPSTSLDKQSAIQL